MWSYLIWRKNPLSINRKAVCGLDNLQNWWDVITVRWQDHKLVGRGRNDVLVNTSTLAWTYTRKRRGYKETQNRGRCKSHSANARIQMNNLEKKTDWLLNFVQPANRKTIEIRVINANKRIREYFTSNKKKFTISRLYPQ